MSDATINPDELRRLTAQVVAGYLTHNQIPVSQVPEAIATVYASLSNIEAPPAATVQDPQKAAVSIKKSVQPDYLICLEDGKKLKMLKRYLRTNYGMTPDQYRGKWGLPSDYPMVAPNYSQLRAAFAVSIGLGRKAGATVPAKVTKRPRKSAAAAKPSAKGKAARA